MWAICESHRRKLNFEKDVRSEKGYNCVCICNKIVIYYFVQPHLCDFVLLQNYPSVSLVQARAMEIMYCMDYYSIDVPLKNMSIQASKNLVHSNGDRATFSCVEPKWKLRTSFCCYTLSCLQRGNDALFWLKKKKLLLLQHPRRSHRC